MPAHNHFNDDSRKMLFSIYLSRFFLILDESSDDDGSKHHPMSDASSPGPGLRGNISPLTPDRKGSSATNRSKYVL
jgi:hypothetical protein